MSGAEADGSGAETDAPVTQDAEANQFLQIDEVWKDLRMAMETIQPGGEIKLDRPVTLSDWGFVNAQAAMRKAKPSGSLVMELRAGDRVEFLGEVRVEVDGVQGEVYRTNLKINGIPYSFNAPKEVLLSEHFASPVAEIGERPVEGGKPDEVEYFNAVVRSALRGV